MRAALILCFFLTFEALGQGGYSPPPTSPFSANLFTNVDGPGWLAAIGAGSGGGATNGIQQLNGHGTNTTLVTATLNNPIATGPATNNLAAYGSGGVLTNIPPGTNGNLLMYSNTAPFGSVWVAFSAGGSGIPTLNGTGTNLTLHSSSSVALPLLVQDNGNGSVFYVGNTGITNFVSTIMNSNLLVQGAITGSGSGISNLNATLITSGTVPAAQLGSGSSSTTVLHGNQAFSAVSLSSDVSGSLPAASINGSHTLSDGVLSTNVPLANASYTNSAAINTYTGEQDFNGVVKMAGSGISITGASSNNSVIVTNTITYITTNAFPANSATTNYVPNFATNAATIYDFTIASDMNFQFTTNQPLTGNYREIVMYIKGSASNFKMFFPAASTQLGSATNNVVIGNSNGAFVLAISSRGTTNENKVTYALAVPAN